MQNAAGRTRNEKCKNKKPLSCSVIQTNSESSELGDTRKCKGAGAGQHMPMVAQHMPLQRTQGVLDYA